MTSEVRYEIKTSLPVIWLETIDTKNPGRSVRNELTVTKLILVDPVEDEDVEEIRPRTDPPNFWRSKEKKECYSHCYSLILIVSIITLLLYIGFG